MRLLSSSCVSWYLVYEFAKCQGDFDCVEVFALYVLNQGHLGQLDIVCRAYICRYRGQACHEGCAVAAFAGDNLVAVGPCLA